MANAKKQIKRELVSTYLKKILEFLGQPTIWAEDFEDNCRRCLIQSFSLGVGLHSRGAALHNLCCARALLFGPLLCCIVYPVLLGVLCSVDCCLYLVLHCNALCSTVLHCVALCCTVLHCVALCCTLLHCVSLYFTVLHVALLR